MFSNGHRFPTRTRRRGGGQEQWVGGRLVSIPDPVSGQLTLSLNSRIIPTLFRLLPGGRSDSCSGRLHSESSTSCLHGQVGGRDDPSLVVGLVPVKT